MISVVVPAYNEEEVIGLFLKEFKKARIPGNFELIVVNDGSTDNTEKIIKKFQKGYKKLRLVSYFPNKGFGHAIRVGFSQCRGDTIVTMDSDLSHPPSMIGKMVEEIDGFDMIVASRYIGVKKKQYKRYYLSKFTNLVTRFLIRSNIKDITSGFRVYRADKLKALNTKEEGFEVEMEIFVKLLKNSCRIKETPLPLIDRKGGESKFIILRDGPRYCFSLFKIFLYRWVWGN